MALTNEEIIEMTNQNPPMCNCCNKRVTRVILPHTPWNESGNYLFHCKITGTITPITDIETVVRSGRQEKGT